MDLFIINRYRDSAEDIDLANQEVQHLQKLKEKIEERKKVYSNLQSKSNVIILKQDVVSPTEEQKINVGQKTNTENEINKENNIVEENDHILKNFHDNSVKAHDEKKTQHEFKILGANEFQKKNKVKRILPHWLSHPYSISSSLQNLTCSVKDLSWLHSTLKTTLLSENISHLFPVQEQVIPFILKEHSIPHPFIPHDVCVSAPTGSGKTLSFVLPIVQILMNEMGHHIRALIVLPVQELATQVAKVFKKYCTKTMLKVALLTGSTPLRQEQQQIVRYTETSGWICEIDIIVCTAGRLVEHIQNTEGFSLKNLKFLVIDEADRIMDHIQNDWLYHLEKHIKLENELMMGRVPSLNWNSLSQHKSSPHKLLFSATLSQDPEKLDQWGLFQPKLFTAAQITEYEDETSITKYTTPDELKEQFVICEAEEKPLLLYHFIVEQKWDKVLCFTNSSQSAHRLTVLLAAWGKGEIKVAELSGALDRSKRDTVLKRFTQSDINVLIGTDALARGIDIPDCNYVISYDPPRNIKTYIHRIGRTGRAGRTGYAVTILLQNQIALFKEILQSGGKSGLFQINIKSDVFERLIESYESAIKETKKQIQEEINSKVKKSIALKREANSKAKKRKYGHISKKDSL